jgi:hypothetical protein
MAAKGKTTTTRHFNGDVITQEELRIVAEAKRLADRISANLARRIELGARIQYGPIVVSDVTPLKARGEIYGVEGPYESLISPWGNDAFMDIGLREAAEPGKILPDFQPEEEYAGFLASEPEPAPAYEIALRSAQEYSRTVA